MASLRSAALCLIPSILLLSFALAAQASYRFTTNYGGYRSGASRFAVPTAFAARAVPAVPTYEALSVAAPAVPTYEALPVAAAPAAPVAAPVYTAAALTYEAHPDPVPEPYTFAPAQPAAPAPAAPSVVSSQYHAQDELGHVEYGYSNVNSQKQESRDAYGNVQGSYSYIDAYGLQRIVRYVSDEWGFRIVGANNLPVAPVDTPEVAQAKAAHFRALAAVGSYH